MHIIVLPIVIGWQNEVAQNFNTHAKYKYLKMFQFLSKLCLYTFHHWLF